jgi:hypothetical protein
MLAEHFAKPVQFGLRTKNDGETVPSFYRRVGGGGVDEKLIFVKMSER